MILPQRLVLDNEIDKDQNPQGKRERKFPQKRKHRRSKARAREIPRVIPREKEESPHNQIKRMEKVQKTWNPPAGPERRIQGKEERKTQEKVVRKEKTTTARVAAKQGKGQK